MRFWAMDISLFFQYGPCICGLCNPTYAILQLWQRIHPFSIDAELKILKGEKFTDNLLDLILDECFMQN